MDGRGVLNPVKVIPFLFSHHVKSDCSLSHRVGVCMDPKNYGTLGPILFELKARVIP